MTDAWDEMGGSGAVVLMLLVVTLLDPGVVLDETDERESDDSELLLFSIPMMSS